MAYIGNIIFKLKYALKTKGFLVTINTTEFYSDQSKRFITLYHVRHGKEEYLSTGSQYLVVNLLKQIWECVQTLENTGVPKEEWAAAVHENLRNIDYMKNYYNQKKQYKERNK
jgi:hypothetical protein